MEWKKELLNVPAEQIEKKLDELLHSDSDNARFDLDIMLAVEAADILVDNIQSGKRYDIQLMGRTEKGEGEDFRGLMMAQPRYISVKVTVID